MYNEIVVVEGIQDEERLKKFFPNIETVSVNGSEISKDCIDMLKELSKTRKLILFFDPDSPGKRIRNIISEQIPNVSHACIKKSDAISKNKKKVGVEHASKEIIVEALENILTPNNEESTLTINDLYNLGLNGSPNSKELRMKVCEKYHLDNPNAKALLKRLNMLKVSIEEVKSIL